MIASSNDWQLFTLSSNSSSNSQRRWATLASLNSISIEKSHQLRWKNICVWFYCIRNHINIFIHELFKSCRTRNDESSSSRILLHYNLLHINYALLNSFSSKVQTYQVMFIACSATFNSTNSSSMRTLIESIANTFWHVLKYLQRRNILHQRSH